MNNNADDILVDTQLGIMPDLFLLMDWHTNNRMKLQEKKCAANKQQQQQHHQHMILAIYLSNKIIINGKLQLHQSIIFHWNIIRKINEIVIEIEIMNKIFVYIALNAAINHNLISGRWKKRINFIE